MFGPVEQSKKFSPFYKMPTGPGHYFGRQAVGRLYGAKTTPHMFVIDPDGLLIYAGAIDDIPSVDPADVTQATNYVQLALDAAMAGQPIATPATKSYGCSVKYD